MNQTSYPSKQSILIAFASTGTFALILIYLAFRWLNYGTEVATTLQTTFQNISHPPKTEVIHENRCTGIGGGASPDLNCGIQYYCAFLGSNLSFSDIQSYYQQEALVYSWQQIGDGIYRNSDAEQLEILEGGVGKPLGIEFDVPLDVLNATSDYYATTFLIIVSSTPRPNCS